MNTPSKNFRDLIVWQKAHQFVLETYDFTKKFPKEEVYCLTSQFRRAAVSISANIAEGYKKKGKNDKLKFYNIAEGSLSECQYYCILAQDLKYGNSNELLNLSFEIERLLNSYCDSIRKSQQ
ncbi:MAG: four helix bundle protein [Bacteroidetes bacterium]|nr:four helix bundle protein [Bacteroidota bacterium]